MSRTAVPLEVADLSPFAKSLRQALSAREAPPTHVELLNLLARAAGFRNYQHLRANAGAAGRLQVATAPAPAPDLGRVAKAARYFDAAGRLASWPARYLDQTLCLWVFWSRIPRDAVYTERQVSDLLRGWNGFGDHALIRRAMIDARLLRRTVDGREYRRIEQPPPPELAPLLAHLAARS